MDNWTAGDWGGAFAGGVAVLAAIGKGLAWLLNWQGARDERRAKRLAEWEASLTRREKEQREQLEDRFGEVRTQLAEVRNQNAALGLALFDVTLALRLKDPRNPALGLAAAALRSAFPLDHSLPAGFAELLAGLDQTEGKA